MKKITSSIKNRLQLSFLTFILLSTISGLLSYKLLTTIVAQDDLKTKIDLVVSQFAEARKQEKDFILYDRKKPSFLENGKCESLEKHALAIREIKLLIGKMNDSGLLEEKEDIYFEVQTVKAAVEGYEKTFLQLVKNYKIRGFKDHGLEGDMREVVHQLQECESKEEQWFALMLRRHEKDFFIRQDKKYIATIHKRAQEFIDYVNASTLPHMSPAYKEKTVASIKNYLSHFDGIVEIEQLIGLTKEEGQIGLLTRQAEMTEPLLTNVQHLIYQKTQRLASNSILVLVVSGALMLFCGIGFSLFLANKISDPIIRLSKVVEKARIGDNSTSQSLEKLKRNDELGKLVNSFTKLFQEVNQKVEEISEKNKDLLKAAQKEKERNWFTEGVSLFEGIMAKQSHDLSLLCDEFLLKLVKHTHSCQAALFLKEKNEEGRPVMELQSCYAQDKKRYVNKRVELGDGLVGAVWQEKDPFYMTDIPENYSKVRSGLGQAKPTSVLLVPAVLDNEVEAILEIGAFREFSENEKELIQQVCKGLAGAITRVRLQEQSQLLLQKAESMTAELTQNQEAMRLHLEEMHVKQEEQEKDHLRLQEKLKDLQHSLQILNETTAPNYKGFLIADEDFNLIYGNEYWQKVWGNMEALPEVKMNNLLNLSELELSSALRHQPQLLLNQLNQNVLLSTSNEDTVLSDIKVAEYQIEKKVFYSILAN